MQENFCQFTQGSADLIFGGIIVVAGFVGTPLGGYVFDLKVCQKETDKYVLQPRCNKAQSHSCCSNREVWHMNYFCVFPDICCLVQPLLGNPRRTSAP